MKNINLFLEALPRLGVGFVSGTINKPGFFSKEKGVDHENVVTNCCRISNFVNFEEVFGNILNLTLNRKGQNLSIKLTLMFVCVHCCTRNYNCSLNVFSEWIINCIFYSKAVATNDHCVSNQKIDRPKTFLFLNQFYLLTNFLPCV